MKSICLRGLLVLALTVSGAATAPAQTSGTIGGLVLDGSGAVLPNAQVVVTHLETGQVRWEVSDEQGRYECSRLPVGTYEVRASRVGFQSAVRNGIVLTIGRTVKADMTLPVGVITQTVVVSGDAPLVETASSQVAGLVEKQQIADLPLNGRDLTQLVAFQAGVATPPVAGNGVTKLSVSGGRPYQISFLMDGTDVSRWDGRPGGVSGLMLGVETVQEFVVLTNCFTSEFGGAGISLVSSVTKSGTNDPHGSAYYYLRNSALDAKNYFDAPDSPIPAFRRQQYGGTFGGPLAKNAAFIFGSYEGLRQSLGITNTLRVPSANARQGLIGDAKNPGQWKQVTVNSGSALWLRAFPAVNSPRTFGPDIGESIVATAEPTREDNFVVKVDYHISNAQSAFVRYTFDDSAQHTPSAASLPGLAILDDARNQYVTLEHQYIAGPRLLNAVRFGMSRNNDGSGWQIPDLPAEFSFIPGKPLGQLSVSGLTSLGVDTYRPNRWISNVFDLNDTATWSRGAHSLKFGGQFKRTQVQTVADLRYSGQVVFSSLENFLTGRPQRLSGAMPGSTSYRGFRRSYGALFIQEDWRVSRRLTLNLGLRWNSMSTPTEVNGRVSTLRDALRDTQFTVGDPWFAVHDPTKGFAPRVGFAWDPHGTGRSVVRGGFGVFSEQIRESNYANARSTPPFVTDIVVNNPPWPFPLGGKLTIPALSPTVMEFNPKMPATYQWNLLVQHQAGAGMVVTAGYLGSRSTHLGSVGCPNCAVPAMVDGRFYWEAGLTRPNPAFEYIRYLTMDAQASYHALQLQVEKRYSAGFAIQGNFTFSKALDDGSAQAGSELGGVGNIFTRQIEQDRKSEKALSSFDVRRNLSVNFSYALPAGTGKCSARNAGGIARTLLAGWSLNGIFHLMDGSPAPIYLDFNRSRSLHNRDIADRPDLRAGASNNPVLGDPARYYDPAAFVLQPAGYAGNLGRNTLILPGYVGFDASVIKRFDAFGDAKIECRAEVFNVLNHPNFAAPNLIPFLSDGSYNPSAGVIGESRGTSRQMQLALRYVF